MRLGDYVVEEVGGGGVLKSSSKLIIIKLKDGIDRNFWTSVHNCSHDKRGDE